MRTAKELFTLADSLLESAWPLEPCRQIQVKLTNLRDSTGRRSHSALTTAMLTGGKTKLGGNAKAM
jgi:hypothetical protein